MKKILVIIASWVVCAGAVLAQNPMEQLPNDPAVRVGKLENGLTYYIRHNELPAERAEFYLATNVGALQETPDQDGLAHFLEHMCFNGTKNFPGKGILNYLQTIGASFGGNVNASTGVEQTIYMLNNIPLKNESVVDSCILIMHDYSHFVLLEQEEIDLERPVILEERRQRRTADWRIREQTQPYYYGDSKYATTSVIGSEENLKTFKRESLVNFYKTWYVPSNQALVVVGDVDTDAVEAKIKAVFSDIPAAVNPKEKEVVKIPENDEPMIGIATDPELSSTAIRVLWRADAMPEELNGTMVGKLTGFAYSVISQVMAERFGDITADPKAPFLGASLGIGKLCETTETVFGTVAMKDGEILSGFKAYMTEIEKMRRYGFTDAEINRAKDNIIAAYESAAEKADTRKNSQLVNELIYNFFDNETYMEPKAELELMKQISTIVNANVLNQVLAEKITENNVSVVLTAPSTAVLPSEDELRKVFVDARNEEIQANEAEDTAGELLDASKLKGSKVKTEAEWAYGTTVWTLKNGVKVILKPSDLEKDKIIMDLYMSGGESLISDEDLYSFEDNIWELFLQNSGVAEFPLTTLSKMLSGKNVSAGPYINALNHGISATSTVKDVETAFQLMYLNFVKPRFDQKEYETGIETIKSVLPNLVNQPNFKFQKALAETLYNGNPRSITISDEVLSKASLATIEKNYRRLFKDAAEATVVIAGDFTIDGIRPLVEKYIGSLPKGKKAFRWVDDGNHVISENVSKDFVEKMETPVTTVLDLFASKIDYSQDVLAAYRAMSYILNMRYTTSLREEAGGTYGASVSESVLVTPQARGMIQVYYNCKPEKTDELQGLVTRDIENLASEGPTASEFEMALNNLKKNIPESRIRNSYWKSVIKCLDFFGIEADEAYEKAVEELTPEKVRDAAKALLSEGNRIEVIMRPEVAE